MLSKCNFPYSQSSGSHKSCRLWRKSALAHTHSLSRARFYVTSGKKLLTVVIAAAASTLAAQANTFNFALPAGTTTSGPVSATASITTNNGSITLVLKNNQTNIVSVGQNISGFSFILSNAFSGLGSSVTPSGTLVTVGSDSTPDTTIDEWALSSGSGNKIILESLADPDQTIIGPAPYTNANGSINGNNPHNPFLQQTATFTIAATGITTSTSVTGVTFVFGTESQYSRAGVSTPTTGTPEPGTTTLFLSGLGFSAIGIYRRTRKAA